MNADGRERGEGDERRRDQPTDPTDSPRDVTPSLDVIFDILKNRRRRDVLLYLDQNGDEAMLDTLAEAIAAEENDVREVDVDSSQRKRVYISLYQAHLPKMDDAGAIAYDKSRGTVRLTGSAELFLSYLYFDPTQGSEPEGAGSSVRRALQSVRGWIESR